MLRIRQVSISWLAREFPPRFVDLGCIKSATNATISVHLWIPWINILMLCGWFRNEVQNGVDSHRWKLFDKSNNVGWMQKNLVSYMFSLKITRGMQWNSQETNEWIGPSIQLSDGQLVLCLFWSSFVQTKKEQNFNKPITSCSKSHLHPRNLTYNMPISCHSSDANLTIQSFSNTIVILLHCLHYTRLVVQYAIFLGVFTHEQAYEGNFHRDS